MIAGGNDASLVKYVRYNFARSQCIYSNTMYTPTFSPSMLSISTAINLHSISEFAMELALEYFSRSFNTPVFILLN